jgi:uncharacterized protein YbjT (DUF2867 family)
MKVLITTPNGRVGGKIVPELLAPEFSVRVVTRHPARLPNNIREQVEIVRGSTDDASTLREALEGVDAMFWCIPRPSLQETNIRSPYERFARAAAEAIREAGTPRVVSISPSAASVQAAVEDILNESGAAIRHLRCGRFTENPYIPISTTAAADIADVALRLLVRTDWNGIDSLSLRGLADPEHDQLFETLLT